MTNDELKAAFAARLKASGLKPADARLLQLATGTYNERAGFFIPYFSVDRKKLNFFRFRYLDAPRGFGALTERSKQRYTQPAGAPPEIFLPLLLDWRPILEDPTAPLLITEGELKAACACRLGLPTIGLGGVWNFRARKSDQALIPALAEISWSGRRVIFVYDIPDVLLNIGVSQALNVLAAELLQLGADPWVAQLPAVVKDAKTGLDDYLTAHPDAEEFNNRVIAKAQEWTKAKELFKLNAEVVYVHDPGVVVERATFLHIAPQAFVQHAYANRTYTERVQRGKGEILMEKSAPKEWLKWPCRAEVRSIVYSPGEEIITAHNELNTWPGWAVEPAKGDTRPWHQLWKFLAAGEPEILPWVLDWWAYPLQHPGTKLFTCLVVWGIAHGSGKSLAGYVMGDIYGKNFAEIESAELFDKFNYDWAAERQFVMGTEISSTGHRGAADRIKTLITREQQAIEKKNVTRYRVRDCNNYYFTSNHSDAFFLEDMDRRFVIVEVKGAPLEREFYQEFDGWRKAGGPAHVFAELLQRDLSKFDPHGKAPATRAKEEMIRSSRSDVADWVAGLRENPEGVLMRGAFPLQGALFSTQELFRLYNPGEKSRVTVNGFSRAMKQAGFQQVNDGHQIECFVQGAPHEKKSKQVFPRLWAVREVEAVLKMKQPALFARYQKELELRLRVQKPAKY